MFETALSELNPLVIRFVGALLILFVGFVAGRILGQLARRLLRVFNLDRNARRFGVRYSLERLLGQLVTIAAYAATVIIVLEYLSVTTFILLILVVVIVLFLAVSLVLAVKDLWPNIFAGLNLKLRGDVREGDVIVVRGVKGKIAQISLLSTTVFSGKDMIVIPNVLFQNEGFVVKR